LIDSDIIFNHFPFTFSLHTTSLIFQKKLMSSKSTLSVLLTTHGDRQDLEHLLDTLLEFRQLKTEIIVIDDSGSGIQSYLSNRDHPGLYLFEHERPHGRGLCLNEALIHATGNLIWAPLRADRLNETLLRETIHRFSSDPSAFWVLDHSLPEATADWSRAAGEGSLPPDNCFVWNRNVIAASDFYFNPAQTSFFCAQLALRLYKTNAWQKTDPFFVASYDHILPADAKTRREFSMTAVRMGDSDEKKRTAFEEYLSISDDPKTEQKTDSLLIQARQMLTQGDPRRALESIDKFLKQNPAHDEASRLKVTLLEKLRRHVEASELKHTIQQKKPLPPTQAALFTEEETQAKKPFEPVLSVIIPTTGDGKPLLEQCLISLESAVDASETELIVIDNASIDRTFDYLEQLKSDNFLNIRVITNKTNRGFGASVNQGLDVAKGKFSLILHNDVELHIDAVQALLNTMNSDSGIGIAGPILSKTGNREQLGTKGDPSQKLRDIKALDSACMMIQTNAGIRFDEAFGLAFFEDMDFCNQVIEQNLRVVVVPSAFATHLNGATITAMGLYLNPEPEWENAARYKAKWSDPQLPPFPSQGLPPDRFSAYVSPENPVNPDISWQDVVHEYITDEVKTTILHTKWEPAQLYILIRVLMMADQRELLRHLENDLTHLDIPKDLLHLLIAFYYKRNIYSRCRHYLQKGEKFNSPLFDLFKLRIAVAELELDEAAELLTRLMEQYPCNPELFSIAGKIHHHDGNEGEAKSFYALANQLDPLTYPAGDEAFELKF